MNNLWLYFRARRQEKKGQWVKASELYKILAGKISDKNGKLSYKQGVVAEKLKNWEGAESFFKQAVEKQPNNAQWFYHLGLALEYGKKYPESIRAFEKSLALKPEQPYCLRHLGKVLMYNGNLAAAENALRKAIKLMPQQTIFNNDLNLIVEKMEDKAKQDKAMGVGVSYQQQGCWPQAAEAYACELKEQPFNAELHYRLGMAHERCYRWDAAVQSYRYALALNIQQPEWHFRLGLILEQQGALEQAVQAYQCAVLTRPKHTPYWLYRLGCVLAQAGLDEEACTVFLRTHEAENNLEVRPIDLSAAQISQVKPYIQMLSNRSLTWQTQDNPKSLSDLAAAFYKIGDQAEQWSLWDEAVLAYEKALEYKQNPVTEWYYRFGYCLAKAGDFKNSSKTFMRMDFLKRFRERINKEFVIEVTDLKVNDDRFVFSLSFTNNSKINSDIRIKSLVLKHRERIGNETREIYAENTSLHAPSAGALVLELSAAQMDLHFWDIAVDLEVNDRVYGVVCVRKLGGGIKFSDAFKSNVTDNPLQYAVYTDNNIAFPYVIGTGRRVAFLKRPVTSYDSPIYAERENRAYQEYMENKEALESQKAWLIFEKYSRTAQDNGYYFFLHAVKQRPHVYFVIEKDSPDRKYLCGYEDNVIEFMSVEHMKLVLSCEMLISSEGRGHGYSFRRVFGEYKNAVFNKKYVFLQHGVLAFKQIENNLFSKNNKAFNASYFIVAAKWEREIVSKAWGYNNEELIVSGLSRWDGLTDTSRKYNEIFLMPTWRNWLEDMSEDKFIETDYFKAYINLLRSERLERILRKNNTKLNFYLHPKILEHLEVFRLESDLIKVVDFGEYSVRELLQRAKILITDYSSVAWDFVYLNKPVLFYHFDLDEYEKYQGGYINLRTDMPGKVAYAEQDVLVLLEEQLEKIADNTAEAVNVRDKYFPDLKGNACEIIYQTLAGEGVC